MWYTGGMNTIKVVHKKVGQRPEIVEIGQEDLKAMQSLVGGYIEVVHWEGELLLVCNEEGMYEGKPNLLFERSHHVEQIFGDVFVSAQQGSDFRTLTQKEIDQAVALLEEYAIAYRQRT